MAHWPEVRRYDGEQLARVRMPIGGIGTGCISLGGRGQLVDWQLFNRPSIGFNPPSFFAVHVSGEHTRATRALEIALTDAELAGPHGSAAPLHGLPRFRSGSFAAAYPLGSVRMSDPGVPLDVLVQAFNPLVPGDADGSGLPVLCYRAQLTNTSSEQLTVSVCASLQNIVGARQDAGGGWRIPGGNRFSLTRIDDADVLLGEGDPTDGESHGTMALAALGSDVSSARRNWARRSWGDSLLEFWDDFSADGRLSEPPDGARVPTGSLVATQEVAPGDVARFEFLLAWHFPHRLGWVDYEGGPPTLGAAVPVGNYYTGRYDDAADVVRQVVPELRRLEAETVDFVRSVTDSGIPTPMADAALSNLAVLKTPVCFRIADGTFLGWEGMNDSTGSCHGSCTHVWNYQYALESLFPELAWTMREVEFVASLDDRGKMSFRAGLPLDTHGTAWPTAAADGQMGAIVRLHRTFHAASDVERLTALWPGVRAALEFAWVPGGWDADMDGVMEGCQHNTMDVEYYGPSGVIQSWYLAALAAVSDLAAVVGDQEFAALCDRVLESGCAKTDELLFNGEYYQQQVIPPGSADHIAEGLRIRYDGENPDAGSDDLVDPDLQIGPGCTTDQLVGHTMARLSGLDVPLRPEHVSTALRSVVTYNWRAGLYGHFNHLRTFAANDEAALLNATFPHGGRPLRPFPYCNEVWTGLEYTAAVGLLLEGDDDRAGEIVAAVRSRYDGRRRNPFDEVECGHHYVRSMASWGLVEAWRLREERSGCPTA